MQSSVTAFSASLSARPQEFCELYLFDFDYTLTQEDSDDIDEDSAEELAGNIKPNVAEAFRAIWASNNVLQILTRNSNNNLIIKHLIAAGLTLEEVKKIPIKNKNSMPSGSSKPDWALDAFKDYPSAKVAYYYDDENEFLEAAKLKLQQAQSAGAFIECKLMCVEVPLESKYDEHLTSIIRKLSKRKSSSSMSYGNFFTADTQQNTPDISFKNVPDLGEISTAPVLNLANTAPSVK